MSPTDMPVGQFQIVDTATDVLYLDLIVSDNDPLEEILLGMSQPDRFLPSKLFYDEVGSALFDKITTLDEYYLSRTEHDILEYNLREIITMLPDNLVLIEYGSGSSTKTELFLQATQSLHAYVPIDISREHLTATSEDIRRRYPELRVLPVCADYSSHIKLDIQGIDSRQMAVFFPGSTIGNFRKPDAIDFLCRIHSMIGRHGYLMIGVDLTKDLSILLPAYNDSSGVTAQFNLNILRHINDRFSANFDLSGYRHRAIYNDLEHRIEMSLESKRKQVVTIGESSFVIEKEEQILTEYSHKYSLLAFAEMADLAGFEIDRVWTDDENLFSFQLLRAR